MTKSNGFSIILSKEFVMTKKGKIIFIIANVLTVIAIVAAVLFTIATYGVLHTEMQNQSTEEQFASAIGLVFVILGVLVYWFIGAAITGIPSIVLSSISIKYTKWAIIHLIISIICTAAPFIFIGVMNFIK